MIIRHLDYGSWFRRDERWLNRADLIAFLEDAAEKPDTSALTGPQALHLAAQVLRKDTAS